MTRQTRNNIQRARRRHFQPVSFRSPNTKLYEILFFFIPFFSRRTHISIGFFFCLTWNSMVLRVARARCDGVVEKTWISCRILSRKTDRDRRAYIQIRKSTKIGSTCALFHTKISEKREEEKEKTKTQHSFVVFVIALFSVEKAAAKKKH